MSLDSSSQFIALLSAGLAAGLLLGWMISVIPGLARVDDRTYVTTMQTINREIINPAFLLTFLLPPVVLGVAAALNRSDGSSRALYLALAAAVYLIGVLGVTFGGNIPLNNGLDAFDLAAVTDVSSLAERRQTYEGPWNRWHAIRTVASITALALTSLATLVDRSPAT